MTTMTVKGSRHRTPGRFRRGVRRNLTAYGFLCGALICFAFFSWYPMVREILLSFQQTNFVDEPTWVGLENFGTVIDDAAFADAWINTAAFTGLALVFGYFVPFAAAIVLNELRHAKAYLRFVVYLPVMLPPAVGVLLFKWFYDPGPGLFNQILDLVNIPALSWLDSTDTALLSLVIVSTWMNLGTGTLIYLAALQSIPGELYEAAELDGAGLFKRVWHVTIPQTKLILMVMLLLQIVATMQVFIEPYLLTGGGPENATLTIAYLMYQYAFNFGDFGAGGALGLMLMLVLMVFSAFYLRISRDNQS
ncbi:carbohydrate ABC transporter permease [Streptosporangium roseum]|uniref:Carbohydrate ABC transporter membrane protein 1, CUT1 family n=1 Tax=Streptosporangium roseum (strain ATCC 12428 / DSM 43021 / JCM 3005 / KCTC 9067 / NCIMB 10171 / NRRL 2505 / NI 9100) TaxID=479432 RepID=D2BDS8_STRRD|nr:sugar ABC transporter permease [Streptosporangium roseum]ACZ88170.1 carbohydrate ABC transporter membrane protein 1, CUT1 family [Streptosporangium roseum DSM 43021]